MIAACASSAAFQELLVRPRYYRNRGWMMAGIGMQAGFFYILLFRFAPLNNIYSHTCYQEPSDWDKAFHKQMRKHFGLSKYQYLSVTFVKGLAVGFVLAVLFYR